jgi:serine/threonine-protein kinase HipA
MADAEAACLTLARMVDLTTVDARVEQIAGLPCLIVERFDREVAAGNRLARVHQEDACQALGRDPDSARGRGKYEDAGGPSLRDVASLLDRFAQDPDAELVKLVAAVTFTVCIGNADAHGKNVALVHPSAEHVRLAPLYDTVPTVLWPSHREGCAMTIGGRTALTDVNVGDIGREVTGWRMSAGIAERCVVDVAERLVEACASPGIDDDRVATYVRERATRLLASRREP